MNQPIRHVRSHISRRQVIKSAAFAAAIPIPFVVSASQQEGPPPSFTGLKPLGTRIKPITPEEYQARVARAQTLLAEQNPKLDWLFVTTGTSLYYFTGVHWWPSE